tara:strand:- start:428 stop:598 length:171 start_codon:yes stop_codon:yes gene_type:complete
MKGFGQYQESQEVFENSKLKFIHQQNALAKKYGKLMEFEDKRKKKILDSTHDLISK